MGPLNELINDLEQNDARTAWLGLSFMLKEIERGPIDLTTDVDLHRLIAVVRSVQKKRAFSSDDMACIVAAAIYVLEAGKQVAEQGSLG